MVASVLEILTIVRKYFIIGGNSCVGYNMMDALGRAGRDCGLEKFHLIIPVGDIAVNERDTR